MISCRPAVLVALLLLAWDGGVLAQELPTRRSRVEVVFCLDTTGSMGGLIAGAQQKIWSIVNGIVSGRPVPEVKVGLLAYRDRRDAYVTQMTDLTTNLDQIHATLFGLSAGGGGDGPESVNQALQEAVSRFSWSPKGEPVYRVIFLVGDAPPHMDYPDDVKYMESCKQAVLKDIVINSVRCGGDLQTEVAWKEIAAKAEGRYTSIAQDGGVQVVATPYDSKLAELSGKLVGTGVYAGDKSLRARTGEAQGRAMKEAEEAAKTADSKAVAVAADKGEFRAKSAAAAPMAPASEAAGMGGMGMGDEAGKADLVAAYAREGKQALGSRKAEELPEEMQKMSQEEREAFLAKKNAEREALQKEMEQLSKQRAAFMQEELKKRGSGDKGFDAVVLEMLKEQGSKKGLHYGEVK